MATTRREPSVERREAFRCFVGVVVYGALAIALVTQARRYWPDEWTEPDTQTRDRIAVIGGIALGGIALWALFRTVVYVGRWLRARRWDRMLDRPGEAHLVPPLATHLLKERPQRTLPAVLLLGAAGIAMIVYGLLALAERVPRLRDENGDDQTAAPIVVGALCVFGALGAREALRASRQAREVEELSNRPLDRPTAAQPRTAGDVSAPSPPPQSPRTRVSAIPALDVEFTDDPEVGYGEGVRRAASAPDEPLHILFLRLFDNVDGTERFIDSGWRHFGYVHILESADQVDADELAAAKDAGSVSSLFIADEAELDAALLRQATERWDEPMPDGFIARWRWAMHSERGKYPVRGLLCHGSFWQQAVEMLLVRMDLIVIDLTGYVPANAGTRFELQRTIDLCPVSRITLLADHASDRRFLAAQVHEAWVGMAEGSPNAGSGRRTLPILVGVGV